MPKVQHEDPVLHLQCPPKYSRHAERQCDQKQAVHSNDQSRAVHQLGGDQFCALWAAHLRDDTMSGEQKIERSVLR